MGHHRPAAVAIAAAAAFAATAAADTLSFDIPLTASGDWKSITFIFEEAPGGWLFDDDYFLLASPAPEVLAGTDGSAPARPGVTTELLDLAGLDKAVRFTFEDETPFVAGESLFFRFSYEGRAGEEARFDTQFEPVPAPGAAALLALAGAAGARRRR